MRKLTLSIILWPALLLGCASAPHVLVQAICPNIPALERDAPGPDFTVQMQNFLQGKLPEPSSSKSDLTSVMQLTPPPAQH